MSAASCKMTVTIKLAVPVFPSSSVTVHVIVLGPIGRSVLCAGEQLGDEDDGKLTISPLLSHTGKP